MTNRRINMNISKANYILIIILILFLINLYAFAGDDDKWFRGEGCSSMAEASWNDAKSKALDNAMKNAIEKASGIEVKSSQLSLVMENNNIEEITDLFASIIRTQTQGRIIEIKDTTFVIKDKTEFQPLCCATGLFKIKSDQGKPDPEFVIDMEINGKRDEINFRDGENIVVNVKSSKDCYLTMFNLFSNDSLSVIYPNYFLQDNYILAGNVCSIFPDSLVSSGISLKVGLQPDKKSDTEVLLIIATKEKYPSPFEFNEMNPYGELEHFSNALISINKWLLEIPINERTEEVLIYHIFR